MEQPKVILAQDRRNKDKQLVLNKEELRLENALY